MGIRGLTTFIQNRSRLYMENYELHDTNLVVDGYSIASQLYRWHCKSNDCFGGDYDKYANVVTNFFKMLFDCNITPYVVLDGGYESRKLATVKDRLKNKIKTAQQLNSVTEGSLSVFPIFLRDVFKDIVIKLNVNVVQCDFEGDTETACIAKTLNCPVVSYDSDYYIFDVLYIPFSTFEMNVRKRYSIVTKQQSNFIICQLYRVDKFLRSFGGMDKKNLPILAVLLGNDYVKLSLFSNFYKHLKIHKCSSVSYHQTRIKSLIMWLQNETIESAVAKVLSRYKIHRRKTITAKIEEAIKGYSLTDSALLKYLNIQPVKSAEAKEYNFTEIANNVEDVEDNLDEVDSSPTSDDSEIDEVEDCNVAELKLDMPPVFFENFRNCLYPHNFMDFLTLHRYYCAGQVEEDGVETSHAVSFEILSAINKILLGPKHEQLICYGKSESGDVKTYALPLCEQNLPTFKEIQNLDLISRKNLLLDILIIERDFSDHFLDLFPPSWSLFLITIKYLTLKSNLSLTNIYSLLLCCVVLNCVDKQVGFYRSSKSFEVKFYKQMQALEKNTIKNDKNNNLTIIEAIKKITYADSLLGLKAVIPYFQMDLKMKTNPRLYNKSIIHTFAQFQSCLLHVKHLNNLFNNPFPNFIVSDFYDGTFLYNMTVNFNKRQNLDLYTAILLEKSPTVLNAFELIANKCKEQMMSNRVHVPSSKRRRKRKKCKEEEPVVCQAEENSEGDYVFDPNNKFSLLTM